MVKPVRFALLTWIGWYGRSVAVLVACLLGGLAVMGAFAVLGLEPEGADPGSYAGLFAFQNFLLPLTATVHLTLFALLGRWGRRPRVWAFVLLPVFWSYIPYLALFPWFPPTGAMWLSLLVFARFVELPPYRRRRRDDPLLAAPERPFAAGRW